MVVTLPPLDATQNCAFQEAEAGLTADTGDGGYYTFYFNRCHGLSTN